MGKIEHWELAGLKLGRKVPSGEIAVHAGAELSRDGRFILWPWKGLGKKHVKPTPMMFAGFLRLGETEDNSAVLEFAKKWGSLNILEDGSFAAQGRDVEGDSFAEPIEAWYYLSRRAAAVLSIAGALNEGEPANPSDWLALSSLSARLKQTNQTEIGSPFNTVTERGFEAFANAPIDTQRLMLWAESNIWIRLSRLGLAMVPENPKESSLRLEIDFRGSLFAAIALQLCLTISGSDAPVRCSNCRRLYYPAKTPQEGRQNFCDTCRGRGESTRRADQRRRDKIKEARMLHNQGLAPKAIAKQLAVRATSKNPDATKTVRRWIEKGK